MIILNQRQKLDKSITELKFDIKTSRDISVFCDNIAHGSGGDEPRLTVRGIRKNHVQLCKTLRLFEQRT